MGVPLADQTALFLRACALGCAAGALWELLAAVRAAFGLRRRGSAVLDVLFCLLCAAGLLLFLLLWGDGALRAYLFFGAGLGFALWRLTAGPPVRALLTAALRALARLLRACGRGLLWCFSFPRGN